MDTKELLRQLDLFRRDKTGAVLIICVVFAATLFTAVFGLVYASMNLL